MGLDDSTRLWDVIDVVEGSIGLADVGERIFGGSGILPGCCFEGFSAR